jgi:hypothetical protein
MEKVRAERFEFSLGKKNEDHVEKKEQEEKPEEVEIDTTEKIESTEEKKEQVEQIPKFEKEESIKHYAQEQTKEILKQDDDDDEAIFKEIIKTREHYMNETYEMKNDDTLFPISVIKNNQEETQILDTQQIESQMADTQDIEEYIKENEDLQKHNEDLNTMYNFTMKTLSTQLSLLNNPKKKEELTEDELKIIKASEEINKLINDKINQVDEPEEIPQDEQKKIEKFKSYLFSEATKGITTPELLSNIVNIIQTSKLEEVKMRNEEEDKPKIYKYNYKGVTYHKNKPKDEDYDSFEDN